MSRIVLDPTSERAQGVIREDAALPSTLRSVTVGLLDINKPPGVAFLDRLEVRLTEHGARVRRYTKPTFTKPAPREVIDEIAADCDVLVEALAD